MQYQKGFKQPNKWTKKSYILNQSNKEYLIHNWPINYVSEYGVYQAGNTPKLSDRITIRVIITTDWVGAHN